MRKSVMRLEAGGTEPRRPNSVMGALAFQLVSIPPASGAGTLASERPKVERSGSIHNDTMSSLVRLPPTRLVPERHLYQPTRKCIWPRNNVLPLPHWPLTEPLLITVPLPLNTPRIYESPPEETWVQSL